LEQIKEMAEQAISKETVGYVMTLAEKLRKEGEERGKLEGLRETIELGITLKFPGEIDTVMAKVNKIDNLDTLEKIKEAIKTANDISDILALIKQDKPNPF
jgi:2'-5' RNA ligase